MIRKITKPVGIKLDQHGEAQQYEVRVGHQRVVVSGANPNEAIAAARRALSREMPRLYDVIQGLEKDRFIVTLIGDTQASA